MCVWSSTISVSWAQVYREADVDAVRSDAMVAHMGRTVALRTEGRAKATRLPLERRGDGRLRSWYIDVDEAAQEPEIDFLRKTIYLRDVHPEFKQ
jgi:hypothetical protein